MCRRFAVFAVVLSIGLLAVARSARADAVPHAKDISPFIDDQTIAVVRCDLAHGDVKAMLDWYAGQIQQQKLSQAEIDALVKEVQDGKNSKPVQVIEALRQAKVIYIVISAEDFGQGPPGIVVVPLEPGVDARAVINLISTGDAQGKGPHGMVNAEQIGNCVVGHFGDREIKPQPGNPALSETWSAALAVVDGEVIHVALAPGKAARDKFAEMMPNLPTPAKPTPITTLTQGLKWASLSITLPPKGSATLCVQAADADSAKAISDVVAQMLPPLQLQLMSVVPDVDALMKLMTPTTKADQLLWSIDSQTLDTTVGPAVVASLVHARDQAKRVQSRSNIRQLLMFCQMYANDHDGNYPKDLSAAVKGMNMPDQVLVNPQHPERKPGYVYLSPGNANNIQASTTMVIYETFDEWPGAVNVGYADGHVASITSKAKFDNLLKAAKAGGGQ